MKFTNLYEKYRKELEENELIVKCGWCGKDLGKKPANRPVKGKQISHGICKSCSDNILNSLDKDNKKDKK